MDALQKAIARVEEKLKYAKLYEHSDRIYALDLCLRILREEQAAQSQELEEILESYTIVNDRRNWSILQNPEDGREFMKNPRREVFCKHAVRYCKLIDFLVPLPEPPMESKERDDENTCD